VTGYTISVMNTIEVKLDKSDFEIYNDFLNYQIDGYWLDEKLDELYPNKSYKGSAPTLQYWMAWNKERDIVWKRIFPTELNQAICPILMCPDDVDFSCTLIVAEIENCGDIVKWTRIGRENTGGYEHQVDGTILHKPEIVGSDVAWFDNIGPFEFDATEYGTMIQVFKKQFEADGLEASKEQL